ncbi:DUF432 domain-containing protein [Prosthecochloris vibrioformis]|uniref:DUF432 domain-containing protein n=1 Tax=Prosthecochloris vibrioformis TaxID=1098 RepID=A0A5C4S4F5_PROVB|nr:DUF432 domain-containing protein [Prosthecochloris vibrioformis]TNJ38108.1 DUF432 domain-containing protein [Prosthecochloris vibrioformis]
MVLTDTGIWGVKKLVEHDVVQSTIGGLRLYFRKVGGEVLVASGYRNPKDGAFLPAPEDTAKWSRWVSRGDNSVVDIQPTFPDRSLVVKPDMPFRLVRGAQTKIYVSVPVWVVVAVDGARANRLLAVPTEVLSNTWFGTLREGELCYWHSSGFRRDASPGSFREDRIICPLRIYNQSSEDFPVEKICLRLENYSLYYDGQQLWSDEVRISYKGPESISQVKVVGKAPDEAPEARLLATPLKEMKKSFAAKTFSSIREFSGLTGQ